MAPQVSVEVEPMRRRRKELCRKTDSKGTTTCNRENYSKDRQRETERI